MPGAAVDFIDGKDLTFEESQGCAYYQSHRISLQGKPLEVLRCIHASHPSYVTNEDLRKYVWRNVDVDPNLPQQHVTKLNKILRTYGLYVHSVPNLGYVLAQTGNESPRALKSLNEQSRKYKGLVLEAQAHARPALVRAGLDELISVAGLSAFYPSRDYYSKYRDAASIDQYVSTATCSVVMVSINLMTGIPIDGVCEALIKKLKTDLTFTAIVSLLNPELPHLMASLAPVLSTKPADLADSIRQSLNRLNDAKTQLRPKDRGRFSIRVHDTIPMGSAILIDHKELFGRIQIESKVYKAPPRKSFAFEVVRTGSEGFYETVAKGYDDLVADGQGWPIVRSGKKKLTRTVG